jgi:Tfp pilus assembly protein PilF
MNNNINSYGGQKRIFNNDDIEAFQPPHKHSRREESDHQAIRSSRLYQDILTCKDVITKISSYLSIKDLLSWESINQEQSKYTEGGWFDKRQAFMPKWGMCEKEPYKHKWNVCLTVALECFIDQITKSKNIVDVPLAQDLYAKFQGLNEKFPLHGCYIQNEILKLSSSSLDFLNSKELREKKEQIHKLALEKWGGEMTLQALLEMQKYFLDPKSNQKSYLLIEQYANQAIHQKATCISLLAIKLFLNRSVTNDHIPLLERLSVEAAKEGSFAALEVLLNIYSSAAIQRLIDQKYRYAPVLARYSQQLIIQQEWKKAESLLAEAMDQYGPQVPAYVLVNTAIVKLDLQKYAEAEALFAQAIDKYGPQVAPLVLANAGLVKLKLQKYAEADALYAQAIDKFGPQVPAAILDNAARVKFELQKYAEADALFAQAIDKDGPQVSAHVLADAATVKVQLQKYAEAEALYAQAIAKWGPQVPVAILANAARVKVGLQKYAEAEALYAQIIDKFGPQVSAAILANAALVKLELQKHAEAEALFAQAIDKGGHQVPAHVLANAAKVKLELQKYAEANNLYKQ